MINTIDELIEYMKNSEGERTKQGKEITGCFAVMRYWFEQLKSDYKDEYLHKMNGMLCGLEAAHFISQQEADRLTEELTDISRKGRHMS